MKALVTSLTGLLCLLTFSSTFASGAFPAVLPEIARAGALADWQLGIVAGAFGFARMVADVPLGLFLTHHLRRALWLGPLVMASGADNPVTLNFLPETHVVVVEDKALVGGYEGAWEKIRSRFGRRVMPRTVNFISGPSRTADIGGQLVMGAHGPRRLCVILVRG